MMTFFPHLPVRVPFSPGIAHWWDPFWWLFQIVIMTVLLITFRKVALRVDDQFDDKPSPPHQENSRESRS